jgi:RNA polymerase sigma-70 factor (ECF subfamily)
MTKPCVQQANPVSDSSMAVRTEQKRERTEAEIIRRAQSGDAEAFEHLYRLHSRRVYALCIRMTANSSLAEDLTQEAFLQVFRKIRSFRGNSAFSTWLHRVTFNTVLMHCRKKRVAQMSLETAISGVEDSQPTAQIGADDASLSSSLERVMLNKAVQRLPRGYKRVLLLHDVLGYEHHEIANALGCAHGTSKSQLTKARRYLRRLLQGGLGKLPERARESA